MTRCVTIDIQVELHNLNEGSLRQHFKIPTVNMEKKAHNAFAVLINGQ